jgi:hypothetical protein
MEVDQLGVALARKRNGSLKIRPSELHLLTAGPPGAGGVSSDSREEQIVPDGPEGESKV